MVRHQALLLLCSFQDNSPLLSLFSILVIWFLLFLAVFPNILFFVCRWSTFEKYLMNSACSNGSLKSMPPCSTWSAAVLWKSCLTLRGRLEIIYLPFSSINIKGIQGREGGRVIGRWKEKKKSGTILYIVPYMKAIYSLIPYQLFL